MSITWGTNCMGSLSERWPTHMGRLIATIAMFIEQHCLRWCERITYCRSTNWLSHMRPTLNQLESFLSVGVQLIDCSMSTVDWLAWRLTSTETRPIKVIYWSKNSMRSNSLVLIASTLEWIVACNRKSNNNN